MVEIANNHSGIFGLRQNVNDLQMTKKSNLLGIAVLVISALVIIKIGNTRSEIVNTSISSDGKIVVSVMGVPNRLYPLVDGVDVVVIAATHAGETTIKKTIDTCDRWGDLKTQYRDIFFKDDNVFIGPEYWNGKKFTYFVISTSKLRDSYNNSSSSAPDRRH